MSTPLERLTVYVKDALDAILTASSDNGDSSFTCTEVERVAELFEIVGMVDEANMFRMNHAGSDGAGDLHRLCQQCREVFVEEHDMCGPCLHDAKRSGWEPGEGT